MKTPIVVVAVVLLVAMVGYLGSKAMKTGDLDQGQVQYTPGKPPWLETDAAKRGPGGPPPSSAAAPGGATSPAAAPPGGGPPGMTAPTLGSGK
ncbi:hypothetical protein [Fimbriimonas ginsengisoli]|nr:hypothetical protein [Fimbriimonas ginsengisoli]